MRPIACGLADERNILRRLFGARKASDPAPLEATVVAISSGKGGTGKSFLATNMAVALARHRRRVTLVDCDFGLGNAHLLLGMNPRLTMQHVLTQQASIAEVHCRSAFGPALVPAGSGISRLAELSEKEMLLLAQGLEQLALMQDVLILDSAAGISPQSLLMLLASDHVVVVTNPEIAALTDAYALIKCLSRQPTRPEISVVVNRASGRLGRATVQKLRDVSRRFSGCEIHPLGEVPDDAAVAQRRLGQPPLVVSDPDREASRCIERIVERLEHRLGGLLPQERSPGHGIMQRFQRHLLARSRR